MKPYIIYFIDDESVSTVTIPEHLIDKFEKEINQETVTYDEANNFLKDNNEFN